MTTDTTDTLSFPGTGTYWYAANQQQNSGYIPPGGSTNYIWATGSYLTETFTGVGLYSVSSVQFSFSVDSGLLNGSETWDTYLNGQLIGSDTIQGNSGGGLLFYGGGQYISGDTFTFTDSFAPIVGNGTYTLEFYLAGGVAPGYGSIQFRDGGLATLTGVAAIVPSVTTISANTDSGATDLNADHVITISLSLLNEPVYVSGSPFLLLNDNEVASYVAGSGTQSLTFKYTVQQGDNVADLQVSGLKLNGGTIQDSSGIPLTGPVQGDLALQIDTTAPTPFMSDVLKNSNNSLTTLSGQSEAGSTVSVFDGTKPLGTVKADSAGNWSLQTNISGGTHQFTETATDLAGNTGNSAGATVYAPGGNKTLTGGSGNDFLIGGKNDTLIGGAGNDTFVFNQGFGNETIADFNPTQDELAFNHALFAQSTAAFVLSHAHDTSFGAEIVVDPHDTVTLTGVTVAQLQAAQTAHQNWVHFF